MTITPSQQDVHPMLGRIAPTDWGHVEKHPMEAHLAGATPIVHARSWATPLTYNQEQTPQCVGYSWATCLTALEYATHSEVVPFEARRIYNWANLNDGLPQPHDGSMVRSGGDALRINGALADKTFHDSPPQDRWKISSFVNTTGVDTLTTFVINNGPVVIGINWYNGFFTPDANGFIKIVPNDPIAGGHAICVRAVDLIRGFATLHNTWGKWGYKGTGDAFISLTDLATLLAQDGEACGPVILAA